MAATSQTIARPPFWLRLSVTAGNLLQLAGLVVGAVLLYVAAHIEAISIVRIIIMLFGWFLIYVCCHSLAHWLVGRLVGIRFRGYGIRGTDHPENYPPGLRQAMTVLPMFTVMTDKDTMAKASPLAKALMFSAGETSSTVCSIVAGWYAWSRGIPGGGILFVFSVIFSVAATISTAQFPKGDYAKAIRTLRGEK
jgi:hypothetical protein